MTKTRASAGQQTVFHTAARIVAWGLLAYIAFVTLSPIQYRPVLTSDPQIERFGAFLFTGLAFAIAYPKNRPLTLVALVLAVIALEAAQLLVPGRDGHVRDAAAKAFGVLVGVGAAWATDRIRLASVRAEA
jgi:VanZ family protein